MSDDERDYGEDSESQEEPDFLIRKSQLQKLNEIKNKYNQREDEENFNGKFANEEVSNFKEKNDDNYANNTSTIEVVKDNKENEYKMADNFNNLFIPNEDNSLQNLTSNYKNYNHIPRSLVKGIPTMKSESSIDDLSSKKIIKSSTSFKDKLPSINQENNNPESTGSKLKPPLITPQKPANKINLYTNSKLSTLSKAKKLNVNRSYIQSVDKIQHNFHSTPLLDSDIKQLQRNNSDLRSKLKGLNEQLNSMLDKIIKEENYKLLHNVYKEQKEKYPKYKNEEKVVEKEIEIAQKTLENLISEYNKNFKKFHKISDVDYFTQLREEINHTNKEILNYTNLNKELESKIKQSELEIKKYTKKKDEVHYNKLKEVEDIDYKIELYLDKIQKLKLEEERLKKVYVKEEDSYNIIIERHNKLIEIIENYEINLREKSYKSSSKEKEEISKKFKHLQKRLRVLEYSRKTMNKNYQNQIETNKRIISQLESKINELENILNNLI